MNTRVIMQLGHVEIATFTLRAPETSHPNLHMGLYTLIRQFEGRKFAFKSDATSDWQHGARNSLYDYIAANVGKTVYVRLYTDVTKYGGR